MYSEVHTLTWAWVKAVLVSAFVVLIISSGILIPASKLFDQDRLSRLPSWLRWILVLPTAICMGLVGEMIPRLVFATGEILVNHNLLFKPGVDELIWAFWAPLLFVAGGVTMAPKYKFSTFIMVGGLKLVVAVRDLVMSLIFVSHGGSWESLDQDTNSPLWWNSIAYILCIIALLTFGWLLASQSRKEMSKRLGTTQAS
jgi:hypothetical protein